MEVFTRDWLIKLYYVLVLFALLLLILIGKTGSMIGFVFILLVIILFCAVRVFTDKVIIDRSKVTVKTLFREKSIVVTPNSLIYIKKSSFTFNIILRINSYSIRIENSPTDFLKINADVQNSEDLFAYIQNLEQRLITPKVVDTFINHNAIKMKHTIYIDQEGFKVGNKAFKYENIKGIKIKDGNLVVFGEGRMWDRALLTKPIHEIPNLQTNLMLMSQFTMVI